MKATQQETLFVSGIDSMASFPSVMADVANRCLAGEEVKILVPKDLAGSVELEAGTHLNSITEGKRRFNVTSRHSTNTFWLVLISEKHE